MKKILSIMCLALFANLTGCTEPNEVKDEPVKFTVTFETNGGSEVIPQEIVEGGLALLPLPPTKEGYVFAKWYEDKELTAAYNFETYVMKNTTLYAKWITADRNALESLVKECRQLVKSEYTGSSYLAMSNKLSKAESVLDDRSATTEQIEKAYSELSAALKALVKIPYRPTKDISINYSVINGEMLIFIIPGSRKIIYANGEDGSGNISTNSKVIFSYEGLEAWAEGHILTTDISLTFTAKSTLNKGDVLKIKVTSAEFPNISKTVTLMVFDTNDAKARFIDTVNSLPEPDKITYEDEKTIAEAEILSRFLSDEDYDDPDIQAARSKLRDCEMAYENLPERFFYSFDGDVCAFAFDDGYDDMKLNYIAKGEFPAGSYTTTVWEYSGMNYYQTRLVLGADKTVVTYEREADDHTGKNATAWKPWLIGTYTYTGDKSNGGIFYVSYNFEMAPEFNKGIKGLLRSKTR